MVLGVFESRLFSVAVLPCLLLSAGFDHSVQCSSQISTGRLPFNVMYFLIMVLNILPPHYSSPLPEVQSPAVMGINGVCASFFDHSLLPPKWNYTCVVGLYNLWHPENGNPTHLDRFQLSLHLTGYFVFFGKPDKYKKGLTS